MTTASFTARLVTLCTSAAVLVAGCQGTEPEATPEPVAPPTTVSASPSPVPTSAAADPARDPAFAPYYEQKLRWSRCDQGFECSTLTVPLDHAKPTGETIKVSVLRVPASGPGKRIGSLLVNPGGPGGDGLENAREAQSYFTKPVRQRYDIVGFDPRGVATSMPIDCLNDRETDRLVALDGSPDDAAERQALVKESLFGQRCKERAGKLLPHIGTPDVARDLDILRAALGDARLYYVGRSYGTLIGAVYAEQFPSRVGRMVLDGAEDPRVSGVDMALAQARGFEQAVNGFVADCVLRSSCPLGRTRSTAKQRLADLLDRVDRRPLPGHDGRKLTQSLAILGVVAAMYNEVDGWPALRVALSYALDGDGSGLMLLSDLYTDREDGRYQNNSNEVIYAVNCLDHPDTRTPAEIERQLPEFRKASPLLGDYLAWGSLPCTYWPVQSGSRPHAITAPGAPPILVVGTTRDPATPYAWSQGLAGQLESGVLLTYEGDGHTAYARGNGCIDRAVETYLLSGKPPADGRRCG